ncbi:hypothetical protein SG34_004330 [Thalassomonas viridans]|uniref:Uncharacterized protein n=1 Tax=Thalassomonas viridans TaxID=137584 RepID=A0AAF0CA57_9GAMM|nr:hypothetical protein [Thalassomonas viridans]WDE06166.1 hypothetical protein SG34_004330 [Thalassomonas viridans]
MAKSNDMLEFHSVKVSLTENIPDPIPEPIHLSVSKRCLAISRAQLTIRGGQYHV